MSDYIVDGADLTSVANAIRAKGGTSAQLQFPQGFVNAIGNISTEEITIQTDGAVTQALDAGKIYHFTGSLTALTITLNAASSGQLAQYHFDFNCGSTVPTVTLPSTVILPDDHEWEASKHYEVDILNNYGAVISWSIS